MSVEEAWKKWAGERPESRYGSINREALEAGYEAGREVGRREGRAEALKNAIKTVEGMRAYKVHDLAIDETGLDKERVIDELEDLRDEAVRAQESEET